MAHCQFSRISARAPGWLSSCAVVVIGLVVVGWSVPAWSQQGLKIRLLNAEEDQWGQSVQEIGADVLTPPGEPNSPLRTYPKTTENRPAANAILNENRVFGPALKLSPSTETPSPSSATSSPPSHEVESPSILSDQENFPDQPNLDVSDQSDSDFSYSPYEEQKQFQQNLRGIREHLLNTPPEEGESLLLEGQEEPGYRPSGYESGPERVWRFSPFRSLGFLGGRFLEPSPSREAFAKLFPWNRTPGRNQGVGEPLVNDSWRWAPFGIGWFMGFMNGSTLVTDWTGTDAGYFGGYHLNWDFDHYWGFEFRYGVASLPQWDSDRAFAAQQAVHIVYDPQFGKRNATLKYGDFSFLYYPWGDARWRPYARMGIGWGYVKFTDLLYEKWSNSTMTMPMGIGLKYRYSRRLVFRMEMVDNFLFGERGINPQHNFSLTAGVEVRFGGTRKAYWPYNPGRHYW